MVETPESVLIQLAFTDGINGVPVKYCMNDGLVFRIYKENIKVQKQQTIAVQRFELTLRPGKFLCFKSQQKIELSHGTGADNLQIYFFFNEITKLSTSGW